MYRIFVLELLMLEIKVIRSRRRRRGWISKNRRTTKRNQRWCGFCSFRIFPLFCIHSIDEYFFVFCFLLFVNTMESGSRLRIFRQSYLLLHGILLNLFSMSPKLLWLIADRWRQIDIVIHRKIKKNIQMWFVPNGDRSPRRRRFWTSIVWYSDWYTTEMASLA